ncbi:RRP15-like protein [Topomyia yanbarensis]|uniref:RRP15-like protein n=1 Tax=Topomyia yanbarensis TaxID=2498891 RepID=UPI00273AB4B1|nr:RRP15-like protein [Topomyia yanbarensis]
MVSGVKVMKKGCRVHEAMAKSDTDSEMSEDDQDEQHLSDAEFPMSDEEPLDHEEPHEDEDQQSTSKWALTMAKYLRKTGDAPILSKVTKEADLERKRKEPKATYKFEVIGQDKTSKEDNPKDDKPSDLEIARELIRQRALLKKERQKDILGLRVKPAVGGYEREKTLKKIATKGTVQLFNAVRQQQRDVSKKLQEAGKLEYKREKVLKNLSKKEFLNVLMNGPRAKSELVDSLVKKEEVKSENESEDGDEPESTWGALRADFLTGKKSGWDKEDDENDGNFGNDPMGGSSDSE